MFHWLANIISSGALKEYHSIEDILRLEPPEGEDFWVLEWAEDMKDQPVFPTWSAEGPLDKNRDPTAWGKQASEWAVRAGFVDGVGLHAPRREILINTNESVLDSGKAIGQVLKFAGQRNPKVLLNHYLDDMCTVDGAAIFLGTKPRDDLTQDFRSATMKRSAQLPQTLPSEVKRELESRPEYVQIMDELHRLEPQIELALDKETADCLKDRRSRLREKRRKLEHTALKEHQKSRVRAYPTNPKEHEQRDWRKGHFDRIRHLKPELDRLSYTLSLRVPLQSPQGISALRDLIALRRNDCRVAYQEVLRPVNGHCPSCRLEMEEIPVKKRWNHVFRCYTKRYKAEFGFAQFCFLCNAWETSETDWEAHCQGHIDNQETPLRCNPVTFRTAIACAGYCPCCLSNDRLPAAKRMHQHTIRANWLRHIYDCIPKYIQTQCASSWVPCPHERCPVVSCRDVQKE
ncbi:hypothetical protein B0T24DRAFT_538692 [Lasiosphaeria ovina]|uniref:Uncharacterized protein n=1 Tax=Lasiosphaeria ovina TaxID=92902 RepID=A0AAE0MYI3_9PEZI|nr:hypothetical protein B0T24DRAFT_538692 [Lasiosphaeria ovina]